MATIFTQTTDTDHQTESSNNHNNLWAFDDRDVTATQVLNLTSITLRLKFVDEGSGGDTVDNWINCYNEHSTGGRSLSTALPLTKDGAYHDYTFTFPSVLVIKNAGKIEYFYALVASTESAANAGTFDSDQRYLSYAGINSSTPAPNSYFATVTLGPGFFTPYVVLTGTPLVSSMYNVGTEGKIKLFVR